MTLSLSSLVAPLSSDAFLKDYFLAGKHVVSPPQDDRFAMLKKIDALWDLPQLVQQMKEVDLFGPNGFRARVPGATAMAFYERGDTLYMTGVERILPELQQMTTVLASELGIPMNAIDIECFATKCAGAAATFHYDHEYNFQLQLQGDKRWRLADNTHIKNPLLPHHHLAHPVEEAYARELPFPLEMPEPSDILDAPEGSVLFFPAGQWHQTEVLGPSFAVNIVLKPARWGEALMYAMKSFLMGHEGCRGYTFGALGKQVHPLLQEHAAKQHEQVMAQAMLALSNIVPGDLGVSADEQLFRWAPATAGRSLVKEEKGHVLHCPHMRLSAWPIDDELVPCLKRIVQCQGWFSLAQLRPLVPDVPLVTIRELVTMLAGMRYLQWKQRNTAS
jgi:hypothetical protein